MTEVPVATAHASVLWCDPSNNSWIPSGAPSPSISKVQLFHHQLRKTFRIVAWRLDDKTVSLNSAIRGDLRYNQITPTFHQWKDFNRVHGLNFSNWDEAQVFGRAVSGAVAAVSGPPSCPPPPPPAPLVHTVVRPPSPDYALPCKLTTRVSGDQNRLTDNRGAATIAAPTDTGVYQPGSVSSESSLDTRYNSSSDDSVQGHRRQPSSSSSGYATLGSQCSNLSLAPSSLSSLPAPSAVTVAGQKGPVPPPLPPVHPPLPSLVAMTSNTSITDGAGGLAEQLRLTRLRMEDQKKLKETLSPSASPGATVVLREPQSTPPAENNIMSEMKRVLAAKKKSLISRESIPEKKDSPEASSSESSDTIKPLPSLIKSERKVSSTIAPPANTSSLISPNIRVNRAQLEKTKQDILSEIRVEISSMKQEIQDALRTMNQ